MRTAIKNAAVESSSRLNSPLPRFLTLLAVLGLGACATPKPAEPPVDAAPVAVVSNPALTISKDIDLVRVSGFVSSDSESALITRRTNALFGADMIINDLQVVPSIAAAQWIEPVLTTVEGLSDVADFSINASGDQLTLGGSVESESRAQTIAELAGAAAGAVLVVNSEMQYPIEIVTPPVTVAKEPAPVSAPVADNNASKGVTPAAVVSSTPETTIPTPLPVALTGIILEQQAAARGVIRPVVQAGPEVVELSSIDDGAGYFAQSLANDADADGVIDRYDACESRAGYPVNSRGCQVLQGHLEDVLFHGNTAKLTRRAMMSLDDLSGVLLDHPDARIAVLSYSGDHGSLETMRGRAHDRAQSVVGYMVKKGVEKGRLQAFSFGHRDGSADQILIKEID